MEPISNVPGEIVPVNLQGTTRIRTLIPRANVGQKITNLSSSGPSNQCKLGNVERLDPLLKPIDLPKEAREALQQAILERENLLAPLTPIMFNISLYSYEDMKRIRVCDVDNEGTEGPGTVNDPRMGITTLKDSCITCHRNIENCPGHYGLITLAAPIFHPMYLREITSILISVCNDCGRLLLTEK